MCFPAIHLCSVKTRHIMKFRHKGNKKKYLSQRVLCLTMWASTMKSFGVIKTYFFKWNKMHSTSFKSKMRWIWNRNLTSWCKVSPHEIVSNAFRLASRSFALFSPCITENVKSVWCPYKCLWTLALPAVPCHHLEEHHF